MNVSVKDAGACRKTIVIEIPADKLAEERNETVSAYVKYANIPGFRKGKAPKNIVARKFAAEIDKDLQERVLPKYYQQALQETKLKAVNIVDVSEATLMEGEPASFSVTVDVEPDFTLPTYKGIPLTEQKAEITDAHVQEQLDAILNQHAQYIDVEDKEVAEGDMAQLTYEATVDGTPMTDAIPEAKGVGGGSGYWVSADEYAFIPGMGKAIVGLKVGGRKEVSIVFPEDFMIKELAGVAALYQIEVTGVRERRVPEIDDAFCKRIQVDSADDLRSRIRENLEIQAENAALDHKHNQIVQYLLKETTIEIPESIVQNQVRNFMYDIARQRMMAGQTQEQLAEQHEEIKAQAESMAVDNVKVRYIGLGIADDLGLEASANEINEEIATMAVRQRKDARELRREMEKNNSIASVGEQVRFNKALDYMVENAIVN